MSRNVYAQTENEEFCCAITLWTIAHRGGQMKSSQIKIITRDGAQLS